MRRLEEDHGATLVGELGERAPSLPCLRATKPSKQNRSLGRPETASAVSTADGPGSADTRTPAACAAAATRKPGSETEGIPASVTTATVAPCAARSTSWSARSRSLCSW
ncbi:hypothetical protein GCM10025875_04500 [Litorihabitans aurantiacus]|uniref:Uncharacterized protein n=1 Tax=Litorihabitans aurantiacus TaxID=1930061 RepID=A0AA37UNX6_9MICO|nr:hypothetical protein GCM10025875_04500 [Litorihabitans aurantiacus]